jgi:hypothetical protein
MVVGLNQQFNLTDIPVVGNLVPAGDDVIALQDVRIVAATSALPSYVATDQLTAILGSVVNSGLVLTIDLQVGTSIQQAFSVRFGGSDDGTASDLPPTVTQTAAPRELGGPQTAQATGGTSSTSAQPGQQASWVNVQRAFGPLQINRIGFAITPTNELGLLLDAAVTLEGLGVALTGLEAEMPIASPFVPSFDLAGLQVQYGAASFSVAGGLEKVPASSPVEFTGELQMTIGSFGATAFGSYTTVNGQPSLFFFLSVGAGRDGRARRVDDTAATERPDLAGAERRLAGRRRAVHLVRDGEELRVADSEFRRER